MTATSKPTLSVKAYAKIILHAAKHPFCETSGLLLADASSQPSFLICDAVPLFHRRTTLAPPAELAVEQVQAFCANNNFRLAGYYVANESPGHSLSSAAARFASKLRETLSDRNFFIVTVDNDMLGSVRDANGRPAVVSHVFKENQWRADTKAFGESPDSPFQIADDATLTAAQQLSVGLHHKLVDFDDHLDDVRLDWLRNVALEKKQTVS